MYSLWDKHRYEYCEPKKWYIKVKKCEQWMHQDLCQVLNQSLHCQQQSNVMVITKE